MERLNIKNTNIFFGIFMAAYVGLSLIVGSFIPAECPYWLNLIISEAIILAPVICLLIVIRSAPHKMLFFSRVGIGDVFLAYVGAYCLMPLIYLLNYITMFFARNHVNGMVSGIYEYSLLAQLFLMAFMPAVVEEFIFRGIFYGSYRRKNVIRAALMSGLLFGITHLNLNQFAYAFAIGVAFCVLYEASGNIILSMTAHFAINANTVSLLQIMDMGAEELEAGAENPALEVLPTGMVMMALAFLAGFAVLGLFFFSLIVKKIAKRAGRLDELKISMTDWKRNGAEGNFLDCYMIIFLVAAIAYMIWIELG